MKEQKQQRIKENMDMEMKKKRYQEERLKMMENDKIARERQLKIELDKKLRDADAVRNQKLQSDAVVLQRRNHIKFLAFQETYEDVKKIQEEENAEKKKRLSERLEQAQKNNQELVRTFLKTRFHTFLDAKALIRSENCCCSETAASRRSPQRKR
jgi:hypothetical protein